jgi:hypothetical protein
MSDLNALRDLTRNRQGEPLTITSGSDVTTSAAPGADIDASADVRACSVTSGNNIRSNVWTVRGIFNSLYCYNGAKIRKSPEATPTKLSIRQLASTADAKSTFGP